LKGPCSAAEAIKEFEKKFSDKTKNKWADRADFKPAAGKYTLVEIDHSATAAQEEKLANLAASPNKAATAAPVEKTQPSKLDASTQKLMDLIFNKETFNYAMSQMNIDVLKMPLGAVTKAQLAKGYECLLELQQELEKSKSPKKEVINACSSRFYTLIPHSFGRNVPPPIGTTDELNKKLEMLNVLGDIVTAQALESKPKGKGKGKAKDLPAHPLDENYASMGCSLKSVGKSAKEYKVIEKYVDSTKPPYYKDFSIMSVWEVERDGEAARFKEHDKVGNRKLLWHGTNVAVVAAILNSGLRIMPHSGGRVGKGIYLASENAKSAGYVCPARTGEGMMFLCEAALGKEHHIQRDDSSLRQPPKGFDSIVAKGRVEPEPTADIQIKIGNKQVTVPQGKPVAQPEAKGSSFAQSEYLLYKESQVQMRYLIMIKFR